MLDPGQGRRRRAGGRLRAVAVYAATAPVRIDGGRVASGWVVEGSAADGASKGLPTMPRAGN